MSSIGGSCGKAVLADEDVAGGAGQRAAALGDDPGDAVAHRGLHDGVAGVALDVADGAFGVGEMNRWHWFSLGLKSVAVAWGAAQMNWRPPSTTMVWPV